MTRGHELILLAPGLSLGLTDAQPEHLKYPTASLQRGLLLFDGDTPLADEAVGFGVPILKTGLRAIFPGAAQFDIQRAGKRTSVRANFRLNMVERLRRGTEDIVDGKWLYTAKDLLAATIRRVPAARGSLTAASSWLRRQFSWQTSYVAAGFETQVAVKYRVESSAGRIRVEIDCSHLPADVTEVVLMHEQGAHVFDRYQDSSGLRLSGNQIGPWDEVHADEAWFESSSRRLAFRLGTVPGTRLFRGRELIDSRLAWAGFGYSFPPSLGGIQHEITVSRLP
jgi:hypothetical protein